MTTPPKPGNYNIKQLVNKDFVYYDNKHDFFRFSDGPGDDNAKQLLMPARDPQTSPPRYYVFNWESQRRDTKADGDAGWSPPTAWEVGMGDHDGVASRAFSGAEAQQFIFEPHPTRSGVYCIQSVASGLYLYKSNHKQYDHDCLRQSTNPGEDDDRFHYSLNLLAPVITPAHRGLVRDPTRDPIPPPPKPLNADQMPPSPLPVLLGETLLPFYQNSDDPDAVGNLRRYQVDKRQYYVLKREQYWKFNPPVIRPVPNQQTEVTITHEAGLTEIEQDTVTKHTGLTLNTNKDVNASVSAKKATVSVSHSFGATFQHDTTSTFFTSEQTDQRVTKTVTLSFFANSFPSMVLYWILVDRWSIGEDVWENPTLIGQATSYPENSSVEATSDV